MDKPVSTFFTRLLQTPKVPVRNKRPPDDFDDFDIAWRGIKETLEYPDERQLVKGITSTDVPRQLRHIVDALVYEGNRTDEDTTGACLEYFLKNDLLSHLEQLCEADRPHGVKGEVLRAINNLVVLLSERFLVHNAVHRPLRRLLRSCVGDEPEDKVDGGMRIVGAAAATSSGFGNSKRDTAVIRRSSNEDVDADLVDLMCILSSRMRAYPPLLLIFFHDKAWMQHTSSGTTDPATQAAMNRTMSPTPSSYTAISELSTRVSKSANQFEFLLFSYLLRFVHREGRIGDFARAGLLFLFDIAFLTPTEEGGDNLQMVKESDGSDPLQEARDALAEFILDGDFADVMAAGLGAVYSLLPTKLHVPTLAELAEVEADDTNEIRASASGGMHLGAGAGTGVDDSEASLPISTSVEIRDQLDLLIKLFGFVQDIITRCKSPLTHLDPNESTVSTTHILGGAISETTLDSIQSSFLDNVLYPSILECSSNDGSAVAVLTYLDVILSKLDDGPLLTRLLNFLLDTETDDLPLPPSPQQQQNKKKRKTGAMNYVGEPTQMVDYFADEGKFTLKDLIMDNLNSNQPSASTAAIKLLNTLLMDHCEHSTKGLLSSIKDSTATALTDKRIPSYTHESIEDEDESFLPRLIQTGSQTEKDLYGSLISLIVSTQNSIEQSAGYANYLSDAYMSIERDTCYRSSQLPLLFVDDSDASFEGGDLRIGKKFEIGFQHRLSTSDPIFMSITELFKRFLENTPDENLALTGTLTTLISCPHRSLAGWITYNHNKQRKPHDPWATHNQEIASDSASGSDSELEFNRPINTDIPLSSEPMMYVILKEITNQISKFKEDIDNFDRLLSERRRGLLFADHLNEAMNVMLTIDSNHTSTSVSGTPSTPIKQVQTTSTPGAAGGGGGKRPKLSTGASGLASSIKSFLTPKSKTKSQTQIPQIPHSPSLISADNSGIESGPSTPIRSRELSTTTTANTNTNNNNNTTLTPIRRGSEMSVSSSPFQTHYEQTKTNIALSIPPSPSLHGGSTTMTMTMTNNDDSDSPWSIPIDNDNDNKLGDKLSYTTKTNRNKEEIKNQNDVEEQQQQQIEIPLSRILDNCIILEEFIKELVAVLESRKILGIDPIPTW